MVAAALFLTRRFTQCKASAVEEVPASPLLLGLPFLQEYAILEHTNVLSIVGAAEEAHGCQIRLLRLRSSIPMPTRMSRFVLRELPRITWLPFLRFDGIIPFPMERVCHNVESG